MFEKEEESRRDSHAGDVGVWVVVCDENNGIGSGEGQYTLLRDMKKKRPAVLSPCGYLSIYPSIHLSQSRRQLQLA